jgi:hypothetical protein
MTSRRRFIRRSLCALSYAAFADVRSAARSSRAPILRVGTIVDPSRVELARGLSFGVAEAGRTASLFNWQLERSELPADAMAHPATPPDVHAIILGACLRVAGQSLPVVRAICDPANDGDGAFTLASCNPPLAVWSSSLRPFGAEQLNNRYRAATGQEMSSDAWLGWFAMKVICESALRVGSTTSWALLEHLRKASTQFDGHKGTPLRFDARGHLEQPVYQSP